MHILPMNLPVPERYFRKLRPFERGLYVAHLRALSPDDRRRRFQSSIDDEVLRTYVERIDFARTTILGCFVRGALRGAGEVAFEGAPMAERTAEVALSVEPAFQKRGIGAALTHRLVRLARNRGAAAVWMFCLPDNEPMRRIARGLGGKLLLKDGTLDARVAVRPGTPLSHLEERLDQGWGLYGAISDLILPRAG
jgi:RimJ/RimL family protein N-acetyltransferase